MKLTSRKKLLEEADKILAEIHTNINTKRVNELDWEEHEKWLAGKSKIMGPTDKKTLQSLSNLVKDYKMNQILQKYENLPSPLPENEEQVAKQIRREIDQMLKDLAVIRKHMLSMERIPEDPQKQTELQKTLASWKETVTTDWETIKKRSAEEFYEELNKYSYIDPNTGLKWSKIWGGPILPDEWFKIQKDPEWGWTGTLKRGIAQNAKLSKKMKNKPGEYEWDSSRSLLWNIFNQLGTYHLSN